jgi:hypothetical protein
LCGLECQTMLNRSNDSLYCSGIESNKVFDIMLIELSESTSAATLKSLKTHLYTKLGVSFPN